MDSLRESSTAFSFIGGTEYTSDLRTILSQNADLRVDADYTSEPVTEIASLRALRRAERFVAAIVQREGA